MPLSEEDKTWMRAELGRFEQKIEQKIERVEQKFQQKFEDLEQKIEDTETKLLRAFHDASPVEMRARSHTAVLRALDVEVESTSDRVAKLERPLQ
jgi:septal ring factor EnvC (AmiA/AmiB activator)